MTRSSRLQNVSLLTGTLARRLILTALAIGCYGQAAEAVLVHQYLFNSGDGTQVLDSQGSAHGFTADGGVVNVSESRLVLNGTSGYAALPGPTIGINAFSEVSLEVWLSSTAANTGFTAAAMLGRTGVEGDGEDPLLGFDYLMLQPTRGNADGSRGALSNGTFDAEAGVTDGTRDLNDGLLHHIVLTVDATDVGYYVDGAQIGTAPLGEFSLANVSNDLAYLGRSLYGNDPFLNGSIYEFRIHDNAFTPGQVTTAFDAGCVDSCGSTFVEINRDTGVAQIVNNLGDQRVVDITIGSAAGSLIPANWDSVANTGDVDNGGSIDSNDVWVINSETSTLLSENDPVGGGDGGPDDGFVLGSSLGFGDIWGKSHFEDVTVSITTLDEFFVETVQNLAVVFVGNGDEAFSRSDFDVDGDIDADDYNTLLANHLTPLTGTTAFETFSFGDVDGDLDNDFQDFRLFKADFIAENGLPAFLQLTGVPEPSTGLLLIAAVALFAGRRNGLPRVI